MRSLNSKWPEGVEVATDKIEMNTPEGGAEALPEGPGCFHVALGLLVVVLGLSATFWVAVSPR